MTTALALLSLAIAQPAPEAPTAPEAPQGVEVPAPPVVPAIPRAPTVTIMDQDVRLDTPSNDVFAMGQRVTVDALVGDNAFVMAQSLDVSTPVGGDLFAMAETVTIDAEISGDVYAMGAQVVVTENGRIGGNLHAGAEVLTLRGPVAGDLQAGVGLLILEAPVAGQAKLEVGAAEVGKAGAIGGSLDYAAVQSFPDLEAVTSGAVSYTEEVVEIDVETTSKAPEEESSLLAEAVWWSGMRFWGLLTKVLVGAMLFLVAGSRLGAVGRRIGSHPGESLGIGFVAACVLPLASMMAIATVLPFPLGLLGFALFGVALYVGQLFAAQALGDLILRRFRPGTVGSPVLSLAVGMGPLVLLFAVPWIGNLAWLAATFLGMGAAWSVLRGRA